MIELEEAAILAGLTKRSLRYHVYELRDIKILGKRNGRLRFDPAHIKAWRAAKEAERESKAGK